ncbi:acetyltransferase [Pectobacterium cacticida]|uniref:Acetyltransferase n=1 Tax=Pectobacterium cacticida TaxID=69221 RepID=A0ABZ2G7H9_9GAMM|nr:acetyltransferase [Pectobacterium cacticida]UYX07890.1 acetyltransferase [Pectobacterium cacticida]
MMTLKYPTPSVQPEGGHFPVLFGLKPQGEAEISLKNHNELQQLRNAIRQRLPMQCNVTCHPHRVGSRGAVALHFDGGNSIGPCVDILISVAGITSWPEADDYDHPRWYISVPDAVDVVYLVLYLKEIAVGSIDAISADALRLQEGSEQYQRDAVATTELLRNKLTKTTS